MIKVLIFISVSALIINFFIPNNQIFLSGEYLFSFDYVGHAKNIYQEFFLQKNLLFNSAQCPDCPAFFHVSLWHSFIVQFYLSLGQILGLNPLIYDLLATILSQLLSLYFFTKLLLGKIHKFPFIIASLVFIFFPNKIYLLPSATKDGLIHALLLSSLSIYLYLLKNLENFSLKLSLFLGLLSSVFLNLAISHFPLWFYGLSTITILHLRHVFKNVKHFIISSAIVVAIVLITNQPLVISYFRSGQAHHLTDFYPLSLSDSLTAAAFLSGAGTISTTLFFALVLVLLLIARSTHKFKFLLTATYSLTAIILSGLGYSFAFNHLPFLVHLRSLYRLTFFQLVVVFVFIYLGTSQLLTKSKIKALTLCAFLLYYLASGIQANTSLFHTSQVPVEYFQAAAYLKSIPSSKIYFPAYWSTTYPNMTGNYSWLSDPLVRNPTLYTNPFTSFFSLPALVQLESIPSSPLISQTRSLIDYSHSPQDIISALEYLGIRYLILDTNYFWSKNFPQFDVDKLSSLLTPQRQFGHISVYTLPDKSSLCQPAYGDFRLGFCHSPSSSRLVNKTPLDLELDKLAAAKTNLLKKNPAVRLPNYIVNANLRQLINQSGVFIPVPVYTADNTITDIYRQSLPPGDFQLFIPLLKLPLGNASFLIVRADDDFLKRLASNSQISSFSWEKIDIQLEKSAILSISTEGQGSIIFGDPLIVKSK